MQTEARQKVLDLLREKNENGKYDELIQKVTDVSDTDLPETIAVALAGNEDTVLTQQCLELVEYTAPAVVADRTPE